MRSCFRLTMTSRADRYLRKKPADLSLRESSLLTSQYSDSGVMTSSTLSLLSQQRKKSWDALDQPGAASTSPFATTPTTVSPPPHQQYVGSDGEGRPNRSELRVCKFQCSVRASRVLSEHFACRAFHHSAEVTGKHAALHRTQVSEPTPCPAPGLCLLESDKQQHLQDREVKCLKAFNTLLAK